MIQIVPRRALSARTSARFQDRVHSRWFWHTTTVNGNHSPGCLRTLLLAATRNYATWILMSWWLPVSVEEKWAAATPPSPTNDEMPRGKTLHNHDRQLMLSYKGRSRAFFKVSLPSVGKYAYHIISVHPSGGMPRSVAPLGCNDENENKK